MLPRLRKRMAKSAANPAVIEVLKGGEDVKKDDMENLYSAVRRLQAAKRQARELGMFVEDRDLLECPACGLWEDVTGEGRLVVYQKDDPSLVDSGLRFMEVDETHFVCPGCGAVVTFEGQG